MCHAQLLFLTSKETLGLMQNISRKQNALQLQSMMIQGSFDPRCFSFCILMRLHLLFYILKYFHTETFCLNVILHTLILSLKFREFVLHSAPCVRFYVFVDYFWCKPAFSYSSVNIKLRDR